MCTHTHTHAWWWCDIFVNESVVVVVQIGTVELSWTRNPTRLHDNWINPIQLINTLLRSIQYRFHMYRIKNKIPSQAHSHQHQVNNKRICTTRTWSDRNESVFDYIFNAYIYIIDNSPLLFVHKTKWSDFLSSLLFEAEFSLFSTRWVSSSSLGLHAHVDYRWIFHASKYILKRSSLLQILCKYFENSTT